MNEENIEDIRFCIRKCQESGVFRKHDDSGNFYCALSSLEPDGLNECPGYCSEIIRVPEGRSLIKYHKCCLEREAD